jgi:predicted N-acetyltransferase YhbS
MPDAVPLLLIGRLAVDAAWRGRGLGSALLADALRRGFARRMGLSERRWGSE